MHWAIATPGRTGSNLIAHHLVSMGYEKCEIDTKGDNSSVEAQSKKGLIVTHDHGLQSFKPSGDTSLCISLRKNLFEQTCSGLISVKTQEFNARQYNGTPICYEVEKKDFDSMFSLLINTAYFQSGQLTQPKWKNSFIIFYEELLEMGIVEFCKMVGMPYDENSTWQDQKSFRRPQDTISNYDELLNYYKETYSVKEQKYVMDIMNARKNS